MKALQSRVDRLEAMSEAQGGIQSRLVLLTGINGLTAEQQAQSEAARNQGRNVFVIVVTARECKSL